MIALRGFGLLIAIGLATILAGCNNADPMAEINQMVADGKVAQAKLKYAELADQSGDKTTRRNYIRFLFEHKQYHDFRNEVKVYLAANPDDKEMKDLEYKHYAKLATDAERAHEYRVAMDYIMSRLLQPDNPDFLKWESRQTTVLKKWYNYGEEIDDVNIQRQAMVEMKNLGFDNLGESLNPDMYAELTEQESAASEQANTAAEDNDPQQQ